MNPEIIKAMNRKNEKHPVRDWWKNNGRKICRVVLFPIWYPLRLWERLHNKWYAARNARQVWSEERANEILNYYVPRRAEWYEESKTFYFFDNGMGWYIGSAKRYLKFKDRRFWKRFHHHIKDYLRDTFELEGFTKELGDCLDGWTEVNFVLNEGQTE